MRIEELRINDWVKFNGSYYKVEEISNKGWIHLNYNGIRLNMSSDYILSLIEPIPLTAEILDKNLEKFGDKEYKISGLWELWSNSNYGYIATTLPIDDFGACSYEPCIPCTYVHQLQHLLDLIEVDKEIKL